MWVGTTAESVRESNIPWFSQGIKPPLSNNEANGLCDGYIFLLYIL